MEEFCDINAIKSIANGAELAFIDCDEDVVAHAIGLAMQSEGFSLSDGSNKHGLFKYTQGSAYNRLTSLKVLFKLDIVSKDNTVIARILDVTPEIENENARRHHERVIRNIIVFLRNLASREV